MPAALILLLRFRVVSSKILVGEKRSLIFLLSKLSFLPRVLTHGIADAVFSTGSLFGRYANGSGRIKYLGKEKANNCNSK